jgi:hypothetical protein
MSRLRPAVMVILLAGGWFLLRPQQEAGPTTDLRFQESASAVGLEHIHTKCRVSDRFENIMPWLSAVGAAAAAGDVDGDGWIDLYVTSSGRGDSNRLFRNRGDGTFEDITEIAGVGVGNPVGASMHAVFGDIDNDGDADLYVVMWGANNILFENLGNARFRDITEEAGVGFWGYGNGATFLDYDRDGRLDLLVGNYFAEALPDPQTGELRRSDLWDPFTTRIMHESFTHAANGGRNILYRNLDGRRFQDVSEEVGLRFRGWTLSVGSADLDNDGWPDLYLANDFGPDEVYFNTGGSDSPPRFRPFVGSEGHPAVGDDWWKGMNVDFGDVDGNGFLDIYVTNILANRYKTDEGNMLWLNLEDPAGGRRFVNVGKRTGTHDGGWGWGAKFADFDNDGRLDILAVNGFTTGDPDHTYWYALQEMVTQLKNATADAADWPVMGDRDLSGHEPNRLWLQTGDGDLEFQEVALAIGLDDLLNGRGAVVLDADNDGDVDVYIANQGARGVYYRNLLHDGPATSHWVALILEGAPDAPRDGLASTRDAVGATVRLSSGGRVQVRQVSGGTGFASQSPLRIHFGLGDRTELDWVEIRWPSGHVQRLKSSDLGVLLDRTTRIVEGAS